MTVKFDDYLRAQKLGEQFDSFRLRGEGRSAARRVFGKRPVEPVGAGGDGNSSPNQDGRRTHPAAIELPVAAIILLEHGSVERQAAKEAALCYLLAAGAKLPGEEDA